MIDKEKETKVLLIGCGPHARRVYIPALKKLKGNRRVHLSAVVELKSQKISTETYLNHHCPETKTFFINHFKPADSDNLPLNVAAQLAKFIKSEGIESVIIATEPLVHMHYARWALNNNLHILIDKPISTYEGITTEPELGKKLLTDILYLSKNRNDSKACIVNVQRRYHPGFQLIEQKINEIATKFRMPITNYQVTHNDGQWRLPEEIISQTYHPYHMGYGKLSHSGYHTVDIFSKLVHSAQLASGKIMDSSSVYTQFVKADALLWQQDESDLHSALGAGYSENSKLSHQDIKQALLAPGEVDVASVITSFNDGIPVFSGSINLLHNSFSQRHWSKPGADLYKGNGRVKHEHHSIQQGPYQNIQVHSYQSKDKHDVFEKDECSTGGNNHFEIFVFRNEKITNSPPFERINIDQLVPPEDRANVLVSESTKFSVVEEFIDIIQGKKMPIDSLSDIASHINSVKLFSSMYISGATNKAHRYA